MLQVASYSIDALAAFATDLFKAAGMDPDKAQVVGRLLVLTDAMGRRTHGLAMAPLYLQAMKRGDLRAQGHPEVIKDTGATLVWDGCYLPGLWLVEHAINTAIQRIPAHGVVSVAVRRSHHIGCLAALVKQAADKGYIAIIANSDPSGKRVAPYGGTEALMTPNPYAMGYPGTTHPVLVDICSSITTTSMTRQKYAEGALFEHPWLLDAQGRPTRDPAVLEHTEPRGSLLALGGLEYGHKGFGLSLMTEALSQGLSGQGRRHAPTQWGSNVFLQLLDPNFFAGLDSFVQEMDFLSESCRANRPIDPERSVRVPGDQAAQSIAKAREVGLQYAQRTWDEITACADALQVEVPTSL